MSEVSVATAEEGMSAENAIQNDKVSVNAAQEQTVSKNAMWCNIFTGKGKGQNCS